MTELECAVDAGADVVMLDNFDLEQTKCAVDWNLSHGAKVLLESSGNVDENNLRSVAETGVDLISSGAITKNIRAMDLSMRFKGI